MSSGGASSNAAFRRRIGIDVGGTKLLAACIGSDGQVVADPVQSTPRSAADLVAVAVGVMERLGDGPGASLGIGIPGRLDEHGVVRFAPNLRELVGSHLADDLREALPGVQLWIGNDAGGACWGEHQMGAGRGSSDMVMVTLGTGIGGGVVVRGELVEGGGGFAGEVGHVVVDPSGPECPCGKQGCWERFASGSGLARLGRELAVAGRIPTVVQLAGGDPEDVRGEHVSAAAAAGDAPAKEAMRTFARWVALGLANLASILDPELIVIGGGLVEASDLLLPPIRHSFAELLLGGSARREVRIVPAALGPSAGAIGAGLLGASRGRR